MRPNSPVRLRPLFATLLLLGLIPRADADLTADPATLVKVADTSTRVNIAKVNLVVGEMSVSDGQLVGTYAIDVPLRQTKSEKGQITLPLDRTLATYLQAGGTLTGKGVSEKNIDDNTRRIEARFSPYDQESKQGRIHLTIETSLRTLEFDSTYTLRK